MADYSTRATDIETAIPPADTLVQPITGESQINALNNIARGVEQGAKVFQTIRVNSANLKASKSRADFTVKLNALQDANDQGSITPAEFRTRSRALLSQTVANDPVQVEEYLTDYSKFQGQSGLDKITAVGVQQAQLEEAQTKAAVDNGFLSVADVGNPEKQAAAIDNLNKFNAEIRALKAETDRISLEGSKLELGSKQRSAKQAELAETTTAGLRKIGAAALPYWRTQYENIKIKADQAGSEQERRQVIEEGIRKLDQDFAQRTAAIAGDGLGVDQSKLDQVLKPQKDLLDTYKKELSGEYTTESFERMNKAAQARATYLAIEGLSEETQKYIAVSQMSTALGPLLANKIQTGVVDAFSKNAKAGIEPKQGVGANQLEVSDRSKPFDPLPSSSEEKKTTTDYLDAVTQVIEDSAAGKYEQLTAPEKTQLDQEILDQMKGIFRGVDVYSNATESAKEFQPVIDFLSNPTVGEYLQGGKVPAELQGKLAKVLQNGYASQVVPLLQRELGDTRFNQIQIDGKPVDLSTMVEPAMIGGRFGFKLKPEFEDNFVARTSLRKLNESSFSKVLNKMIISDAHVRGDTDYNKSYEETFKPSLFPDADGDGTTETPAVDGQTTGSIEELDDDDRIQPASFVPATENPSVDAEVMARFEGKRVPVSIRNNNMGAVSITGDVASSWAAAQPGFVGVTKRPKAEGGFYAVYATPEDGVAAASKLLEQYGRGGTNKPIEIVKKWSVDKAAHNTYANTLVKYLNEAGLEVNVDTPLDLSDPEVRLAILKAKSAHESGAGKPVYSEDVFLKGVGRNA